MRIKYEKVIMFKVPQYKIMSEQVTSTQVLVKALEAESNPALADIIYKAKRHHYNEFKSDLVTPIIALVDDLRAAGFQELAQRAANGEFDATEEESQAWAQSSKGEQVFAELLKKDEPKPKKNSGAN